MVVRERMERPREGDGGRSGGESDGGGGSTDIVRVGVRPFVTPQSGIDGLTGTKREAGGSR